MHITCIQYTLKSSSQHDDGATSVRNVVSVTEKIFFTSNILVLMLNFSTTWLVGHWLMLATQHWNKYRVYSSITPTLVTLWWHQRHIVNLVLSYVSTWGTSMRMHAYTPTCICWQCALSETIPIHLVSIRFEVDCMIVSMGHVLLCTVKNDSKKQNYAWNHFAYYWMQIGRRLINRGYACDVTITGILYTAVYFTRTTAAVGGRWRATDGRFYYDLQGANVLILVFWWGNSSPNSNFLGKNQAANNSAYRE